MRWSCCGKRASRHSAWSTASPTGARADGASKTDMAAGGTMTKSLRLGLRENLGQFLLLVLVNAFVGAMVGMERSILPPIAEQDFQLAAKTAVLSFIVVFGLTKAATNYVAGNLSDRFGRRLVLIGGWIV